MIGFLLALQFLTVIPVKLDEIRQKDFSRAMIYFPVVGLLLGAILSALNSLFFFFDFARISTDTILVVCLIALCGGMHLDGLSDSFDAFLSGKKPQEMLEIMRDSHAGVMGILSVISVVLLKIALLCSVPADLKVRALLLFCAFGRWAMVFALFLFPYARKEGKASPFFENINGRVLVWTSLITFTAAALLWRVRGLMVWGVAALSVYLLGKIISRKLGGLTGDTLGALNEITEVISLLAITILGRVPTWII